jgi:tetratricopeptide (TPR) repeat protein
VQLAHHFQQAHLGYKASRYLLQAGQKAARLLAFDEAVRHFEHGLAELNDGTGAPEIQELRYKLYLDLTHALWHSGRVREVVAIYPYLIALAREIKDPQALAHAVLAYEEPRWRLNLDSKLTFEYLREALAVMGEEQSGLRVRLLVSLSRTQLASGEHEELRTTVDQALQIARQIDDPLALCDALRIKAQIDRRPESTEARLAAIEEMIATAEAIGAQERLADALDLYIYDLLELGQIEQVEEMIAAQRKVAQEIKQPFQLHVAAVFRTMQAILQGNFETAERLAMEAADLSRKLGLAEMDGILGIHMFTIRREQGRLHEVAPFVKFMVANSPVAKSPSPSAWLPGLALIYCVLDEREQCRAILRPWQRMGLPLPRKIRSGWQPWRT